MLRFFRILSVIPVLFICSLSAGAQVLYRLDTLKTTLYFHKNSFVLESDYRGNGEKLKAFVGSVSAVRENGAQKMLLISGTVGASLNGIAFDERFLCEKRISTLKYMLSKGISIPGGSIHLKNIGQNWKRLEECVTSDSTLSNRSEILGIVGKTPVRTFVGDTLSKNRVEGLMKLNRGRAWEEMEPDVFPEMDVAEIICVYRYEETLLTGIPLPVDDLHSKIPDDLGYKEYAVEEDVDSVLDIKPERHFYMALRTNLLYDAALIPNIGADVYLGGDFSISATWEYAYWYPSFRNIIHKVYGGDASVRWWFGRNRERHPLTGHHIGPYGQMAAFDFAYGEQRWSARPWQWAVGLEYGYSLQFKKGRMALDFTIGVGYADILCSHWHITTNAAGETYYEWDEQHDIRYVGPTKAEISLIWLIGGNQKHKKKY